MNMDFKGMDIVSSKQFDREGILRVFEEAREMEKVIAAGADHKMADILKGKFMATLFFEASTRTRFSFESAMMRLGGKVVSNADMKGTSSLRKFETLSDTGRVVSEMVDVIVVRHPEVGSISQIAAGSKVPVINAGEGADEHPTQALLDLYTIWKEKSELDGLTIGMIGDLKNSRVQHSQCSLLKHFNVKFKFNSPLPLMMPDYVIQTLKGHDVQIMEEMEHVVAVSDVISVSRVQVERFDSEEEYKKVAGTYVLDSQVMKKAKQDAIILHPLPRVDEIAVDLDGDPRAKYFEQVHNGVAVRMALLKLVLL